MTNTPFGSFDPATYQAWVRTEADAFISAVSSAAPSAPVVGCPGWTLHDLVDHLGGIHQWATAIVGGSGPDVAPDPVPDGAALAPWYASQVEQLLARLASTDPLTPCWTFQKAQRRASFWSRRQAHEIAVHRVDAELAAGGAATYDADLAVDGIGEVLDVVLPRAARRLGPADLAAPVLVACADRPARWLLSPSADDAPGRLIAVGPVVPDAEAADAAAVVRGSASSLLLTLWRRQVSPDAAVEVEGDHEVGQRFLASQVTF